MERRSVKSNRIKKQVREARIRCGLRQALLNIGWGRPLVHGDIAKHRAKARREEKRRLSWFLPGIGYFQLAFRDRGDAGRTGRSEHRESRGEL
jgi:hypothetical protein